jgi:hypothetical protein
MHYIMISIIHQFEGVKVGELGPGGVILRGQVKWDREGGGLVGKPGDGRFLKREKGKLLVGRAGGQVVGMKDGERAFGWTGWMGSQTIFDTI